MLEKMMKLQNEFQNSLGTNISSMSTEEKTAFIKEHSIHATQELHEMLYELPYFKPWKDYSQITDNEIEDQILKAREEFIDLWHFVLNIALALDLDAHSIYYGYIKKNHENHKRQDEHYTHDKSYRSPKTKVHQITLEEVLNEKNRG